MSPRQIIQRGQDFFETLSGPHSRGPGAQSPEHILRAGPDDVVGLPVHRIPHLNSLYRTGFDLAAINRQNGDPRWEQKGREYYIRDVCELLLNIAPEVRQVCDLEPSIMRGGLFDQTGPGLRYSLFIRQPRLCQANDSSRLIYTDSPNSSGTDFLTQTSVWGYSRNPPPPSRRYPSGASSSALLKYKSDHYRPHMILNSYDSYRTHLYSRRRDFYRPGSSTSRLCSLQSEGQNQTRYSAFVVSR